eukprot:tig00020610_g12059.t1
MSRRGKGKPPEPPGSARDPSLDLSSDELDPLRALYEPGVAVPCPEEQPLDNLTRCRPLLPASDADWSDGRTLEQSEAARAKREAEAAAKKEARDAEAALIAERTGVVDKIAASFKTGPLSLVRKFFERRVRVKIWVRRMKTVRGTLVGYIRAFDRHLNMVLADVEEEWTVTHWEPEDESGPAAKAGASSSYRGAAAAPEGAADPQGPQGPGPPAPRPPPPMRLARLETRRRHVNQLFVRGDGIVVIAEGDSRDGSYPPAAPTAAAPAAPTGAGP